MQRMACFKTTFSITTVDEEMANTDTCWLLVATSTHQHNHCFQVASHLGVYRAYTIANATGVHLVKYVIPPHHYVNEYDSCGMLDSALLILIKSHIQNPFRYFP